MRRIVKLSQPFVVAAFGLVLTVSAAHAQYLDPGAGSVIVQAVIAVAIGSAAAAKLYWRRMRAYFSQLRAGTNGREPKG